MYRRTRKYSAERIAAMLHGKERARMERPAPDYPPQLPAVRMRITIERFDHGAPERHEFTLMRSRRIDQYRVLVDGKPWATCGLSRVLEGLRKATPRMISDRAAD